MIDTVIDTVIFDWGGTLVPWNSLSPGDSWRAYADTAHPDDADRAADTAAALLAADDARWARVRDRHDAFTVAGMRAVLVPHSDIPTVQQVPVDVHPDGVIQRLADLPDLLATW